MWETLRGLLASGPVIRAGTSGRSDRRHHVRRRSFVPQIEFLEGRALPSTFTVLNLADGGPGSLRAAIQAAEAHPGPDTIDFAHNVHGTIRLTTGELAITGDLTINGPGADKVTVSGSHASRIFDVVGGADAGTAITVSISGLAITDGVADRGGGIQNANFSDLTLAHVVVSGNRAVGVLNSLNASGGGISSSGSGNRLSVTDCVLTGNAADGVASVRQGVGGGIFVLDGAAVVRNSAVNVNEARSGNSSAVGGGIDVEDGELTVEDSAITNNRALGFPGGGAFAGGIEVNLSTAVITRCSIAGNEANGNVGADAAGIGDGGGIHSLAGTLTVNDSVIRDNRAVGGQGGGNGSGGGITLAFATLVANNCTFTGNQAIAGQTAEIAYDAAHAVGGAVALYFFSDGSITHSTFSDNRAVGGSGITDSALALADAGEAYGGAIINVLGSRLEVNQSTLVGNLAFGGDRNTSGLDLPFPTKTGMAEGGAIYAQEAETVVRDSIIMNNRAVGGSGNVGTNPTGFVGAGVGGGIDSEFEDQPDFGPTALTILNSVVAHNQALGGDDNTGHGEMLLVGAGLGGGVANFFGSAADVSDSGLDHNRAVGGHGNTADGGLLPAGLGAGGAVFNAFGNFLFPDGSVLAPSVVTLARSRLDHNEAQGGQEAAGHGSDGWGGGIANLFSATTTVTGSVLAHNRAAGGPGSNGYGGGAYNDATSALHLRASLVIDNRATGRAGVGGGVYNLGLLDLDPLTLVAWNHASTSDDDIFGPFVVI